MEASPRQSTKAKQSQSNSVSAQNEEQDSDLQDSLSSKSVDSDNPLNNTTYSRCEKIKINPVLFRFISKFEAQRLRKQVGQRARITFDKEFSLMIHFNDQSVLQMVREFVKNMNDMQFQEKDWDLKKNITHCSSLREELAKDNFYLMKHATSLYLYGTNKTREQLKQRHRRILNEYFEIRYEEKKHFTRTERQCFETIFKCLKNFDKLVRTIPELVSVQPFFLKQKRYNKNHFGSLIFFVKMSKKCEMRKIANEIYGAIKKCRFLLFFVDKLPKQVKQNKKYSVRFYYDKKINKNYMIVAYRKKDLAIASVPSTIEQILSIHGVVIEGFRFFSSNDMNSKASLQDIIKYCQGQQQFKNIELFPKSKPYSVGITLKSYDKELTETQKLLLVLTANGKLDKQLNFVPPGITTIHQKTRISQRQESCQMNFGFLEQKEQSFYFELKHNLKQEIQKNGKLYLRTPVECSRQFLSIYESYSGQQTPVLFSGVNLTQIHSENCNTWEAQIEILKSPTKSYYEGRKKNGDSKIRTTKPLFKMELQKAPMKKEIIEQT